MHEPSLTTDPRRFKSVCVWTWSAGEEGDPFPEPSAEHMLEFSLKVKCQHNSKASKNSQDPSELYICSQGEYVLDSNCK